MTSPGPSEDPVVDVFLLNIFIDHHTVNSHLLMHGYNTDTVNELKFWTKEIGYFYVHCYKIFYT